MKRKQPSSSSISSFTTLGDQACPREQWVDGLYEEIPLDRLAGRFRSEREEEGKGRGGVLGRRSESECVGKA